MADVNPRLVTKCRLLIGNANAFGLELNGFLGGLGSGKVQGWLASVLWNPIIA